MTLATAWCNVSDQGQAKVKVYCFFFFFVSLVSAKIFLLEYCGLYFKKGVDGGAKKIVGAKITQIAEKSTI